MNTGTTFTRVYLNGRARTAHLTWGGNDGNLQSNPALCGKTPALFHFWWGTGTQKEINRAERLPTCRNCEEKR